MGLADVPGIVLYPVFTFTVYLGREPGNPPIAAQREKHPSEDWGDALEEHGVGGVSQERKQIMNQALKI